MPIPKREAPAAAALSNSERQCFSQCRRKWYWQFEQRYSPLAEPTPFLVGGAVHEVLAEFYRGSDPDVEEIINAKFDPVVKGGGGFLSPEQLEDVEKQRTMTLGMCQAYLQVYAGDRKKWKVINLKGVPLIEAEAKFRVNDRWEMYFTVDMMVEEKGRPWLVEHKTTAAIDAGYVGRLALDEQVSTYMYGANKVWGIRPDGVIYNVIMKPRIRQKQTEDRGQYLQRVLQLYRESPQEYLLRERVLRSDADLAVFERELGLFTGEIEFARERGYYPKNTNACTGRGTCPYMALCVEGEPNAQDRFRVRARRSHHDEED